MVLVVATAHQGVAALAVSLDNLVVMVVFMEEVEVVLKTIQTEEAEMVQMESLLYGMR
jgi:hypothetical protein